MEFTAKKLRNYAALRLKGSRDERIRIYDEAENLNANRKRIGTKLDEEGT